MTWTVIEGDCVEAMAAMDEASVDAVVTDPPYGLEFMGKEWDSFKTGRGERYASGGGMVEGVSIPGTGFSTLPSYVQRPAKRCAHCGKQAWSGSPCQCAEPRWEMDNSPLHAAQAWHQAWATEAIRVLKPGGHLLAFGGTRTYHRLACAVEDAGFEIRDTIAWLYGSGFPKSLDVLKAIDKAAGVAVPAAERWQGWGTALKPAHEPIVVARKPLAERNVAANVLRHGTGALNIDGTRIEGEVPGDTASGRWPTNVVLDEEAAVMLDEQTGERPGSVSSGSRGRPGATWAKEQEQTAYYGDIGGASRFFYCPKADREERNRGVEHLSAKALRWSSGDQSPGTFQAEGTVREAANHHPTVKPVELMRWLVRLVTPPGGTVLDPFTGSGSTGIAALREGFGFIGIEREAEYVEIARARIVGDAPLFNTGAEV